MRRALLLTVTMNLEITQDNLYLILPGLFYRSETYKRLTDESTKYWHYGPVALYQEWMEEVGLL